ATPVHAAVEASGLLWVPGWTLFGALVAASYGAGLRGEAASDWTMEVLRRTGLEAKADKLAGALPLIDRKRLEFAKALASKPRLILLDAIAAGLTEPEVERLGA